MDPYDSASVRAVWQRVMAKDGQTELQQSLLEHIAGEYAARRSYEKMASRAGAHGSVLRRMAWEEGQHAKKLSALYDLLFEPLPRVATGVAEPKEQPQSFHEALRRAFRAELAAAERYRLLAQQQEQHRPLFLALAADEERHSRHLRQIAQSLLFPK